MTACPIDSALAALDRTREASAALLATIQAEISRAKVAPDVSLAIVEPTAAAGVAMCFDFASAPCCAASCPVSSAADCCRASSPFFARRAAGLSSTGMTGSRSMP